MISIITLLVIDPINKSSKFRISLENYLKSIKQEINIETNSEIKEILNSLYHQKEIIIINNLQTIDVLTRKKNFFAFFSRILFFIKEVQKN